MPKPSCFPCSKIAGPSLPSRVGHFAVRQSSLIHRSVLGKPTMVTPTGALKSSAPTKANLEAFVFPRFSVT